MKKMKVSKVELLQMLSNEFSKELRQTLTAEEMTQVISRNRNETDPNVCHSHDFCDANVALLTAFENIYGYEPKLSDEDTINLMNAVWSLAKKNEFNAY
jgi:hypothetical protein